MTKVRLPVISGGEAARVFELAGWTRTTKKQGGSHIHYMSRPGQIVKLSIPDHDTLDRGLLKSFIRDAGMTNEQFVALLDG
jgi:predicted RNA binding protein YcfA (HicA-like mRNA interferase family)